jgi:hypothetical protein
VFALNPVSDADTATEASPDPGSDEHATLDPYETDVPYSNLHSLTSPPFGFTDAFKLAPLCVTDDAAPVTTVGALGNLE